MSGAIKLGSLEKTVGTCLLHSGVYYEQSLSRRKNCTTQTFAFIGDSPFFLQKKRLAFFMVPNLFLDHLQPFLVKPFLDQVPNKGFALLATGQFVTRLQEFGLWGS